MQHRQALPTGTRLQEYELLNVLGSGGFGIVYLAYDHELQQNVVIKEYLPNGCAVRVSGNTVVARTTGDEDTFQWGLELILLPLKIKHLNSNT
jgi:serine/threonine protein kinase